MNEVNEVTFTLTVNVWMHSINRGCKEAWKMEQLLITAITILFLPLAFVLVLIVLLASVGKSLGLRRKYVKCLLKVFEVCHNCKKKSIFFYVLHWPLALYVDIAPDGIESVRPNYTFALGLFALGSFALKVGPFALIIKSILMNIINIVIEIKEVTI